MVNFSCTLAREKVSSLLAVFLANGATIRVSRRNMSHMSSSKQCDKLLVVGVEPAVAVVPRWRTSFWTKDGDNTEALVEVVLLLLLLPVVAG